SVEEPVRYRKAWDTETIGVQMAMGFGGAVLAAGAGAGGRLISEHDCAARSRGAGCRATWIAGAFVLFFIPPPALGGVWGGELMGGRGKLVYTFLGAALNLLSLGLPVGVGCVTLAASAGQIAAYHESASPKDPFFDGPLASSLVEVGDRGASLAMP